ncbi:MAG: hypothetical protein P1U63_02605 [Coxiellaceae bacterium]|nr:hypothetical protein [Coxiellaceae bacterium]
MLNNLNWVYTNKPQKSRLHCHQPTVQNEYLHDKVAVEKKERFDKLMVDFNQKYIKLMETEGYADMIFATITPKNV